VDACRGKKQFSSLKLEKQFIGFKPLNSDFIPLALLARFRPNSARTRRVIGPGKQIRKNRGVWVWTDTLLAGNRQPHNPLPARIEGPPRAVSESPSARFAAGNGAPTL